MPNFCPVKRIVDRYPFVTRTFKSGKKRTYFVTYEMRHLAEVGAYVFAINYKKTKEQDYFVGIRSKSEDRYYLSNTCALKDTKLEKNQVFIRKDSLLWMVKPARDLLKTAKE